MKSDDYKSLDAFLRHELRPRITPEGLIEKTLKQKRFSEYTPEEVRAKIDLLDDTAKDRRDLDFYRSHYNNTKKRSGFVDEIIDLIGKHIKPINITEQWQPAPIKNKLPDEKLLCINSDQHIGFIVNQYEAPKEGMTYNPTVAKQRIEKYSQTVLKIIENHRKFERIDEVYLTYLGDGLEGDWKGLNCSKDDIVEQYVNAFSIFASQIEFFANHFSQVYINCIYGNHSRMDKGQPEYVNWEYILWSTVMRVKLENVQNVHLNVPSTPFGFFNIYDKKFCMIHGGGIKMTYRTPYYGLESAHKEYNDIFADLDQGRFDYLLLGHFHQPASLNDNKIKICGSTVGYHPWSMSALRKYCRPSQKMCLIHKEHGIVEDRDIYL